MAVINTFYPGGIAGEAVPHATDAVNATESMTIDDANEATPLFFWTGTQDEYDVIAAAELVTPGSGDINFTRTLYNTTT